MSAFFLTDGSSQIFMRNLIYCNIQFIKTGKEKIDYMAYMPYTKKGEDVERFSVEFYTKQNGEEPAKTFLMETDKKMRAKLLGLLEVLEEYGNQLREPYSKHLEDGLFELRCKVGNRNARVIYFFYYDHRIVLTHGFIKKTAKTPRSEVELAQKYRKDFLEREERHE